MENGRIDRKSGHGNPGLSSTTVRSLHLMLHSALEQAVKERLILRNPTEDCIAPKVQKSKCGSFRLSTSRIIWKPLAGEVCSPCSIWSWSRVCGRARSRRFSGVTSTSKNKTISVSKQYVKNPNGELTLSRPKTETSVRKSQYSTGGCRSADSGTWQAS